MSYSLTIHPDADADAERIATYIGQRSWEGRLRWLDAYEAAQARIESNPLLCGPAVEEPILNRGLRQVLSKTPSGNPYRAVFIIEGSQLTIVLFAAKVSLSLPMTTCREVRRSKRDWSKGIPAKESGHVLSNLPSSTPAESPSPSVPVPCIR